MTFITAIIANATVVNATIYDLTPAQEEAISTQSTDVLTLLNKVIILSSVSSGYALVSILTIVLTIGFILAIAKAIKEVTPVLPS